MPFYTRPTTTYGTGGRTTTLITPNAFDPTKEYPLIVMRHSYGASGADIVPRWTMDEGHNFDDGCFIFAPDGTNDGGGSNKHFPYGSAAGKAAEVSWLLACIAAIRADWPIAWVALWGYSNGGLSADELAAEHPDVFHQLVTLAGSGLIATSTAATGIEVPSITIHGDTDTTVLTAGDATAATLPGSLSTYGGYLSAAATAQARRSRNGGAGVGTLGANYGSLNLVTAVGGDETTRQKFTDTRDELWTIVTGDHSFSFSARRGETLFVHARANHRGV